jgi:drug/metabolite transporter (DMT)-like permease
MHGRYTTRVLGALAITLVLWSSAYAGIRAGLRGYSPSNVALLRFVVASFVLGIYALIVRLRLPLWRDLPGLILSGAIGISFYNLALNYGETQVSAGAASMLIASVPIWTALLATLILGERLTAVGWCGVLVSFAGVALIASGEGEGIHLSPQALVILVAAVTSAIYMVQQKRFLRRYSALEFSAYTIWAGTALMIPFGSGLWKQAASAL